MTKKRGEESWELQEEAASPAPGSRRDLMWQLLGAAALFAITVLVISRLMKTEPDNEPVSLAEGATEAEPIAAEETETAKQAEGEGLGEENESVWFKEDELHAAAEEFLEAGTVEELLSCIRHPKRLEKKVRAFYQASPLEAPGYRQSRIRGVIQNDRLNAVILTASMNNFDVGQMAVVETEDGPKVDWESWVGHGEMSWEEFLETKPTEPVRMRVLLSNVSYYNRSFSDDMKWKSLRLAAADGDRTVYGYVKLESQEIEEIRELVNRLEGAECRAILEVSYPEQAMSSKQVEIHKLVSEEWLMPDQDNE